MENTFVLPSLLGHLPLGFENYYELVSLNLVALPKNCLSWFLNSSFQSKKTKGRGSFPLTAKSCCFSSKRKMLNVTFVRNKTADIIQMFRDRNISFSYFDSSTQNSEVLYKKGFLIHCIEPLYGFQLFLISKIINF